MPTTPEELREPAMLAAIMTATLIKTRQSNDSLDILAGKRPNRDPNELLDTLLSFASQIRKQTLEEVEKPQTESLEGPAITSLRKK